MVSFINQYDIFLVLRTLMKIIIWKNFLRISNIFKVHFLFISFIKKRDFYGTSKYNLFLIFPPIDFLNPTLIGKTCSMNAKHRFVYNFLLIYMFPLNINLKPILLIIKGFNDLVLNQEKIFHKWQLILPKYWFAY